MRRLDVRLRSRRFLRPLIDLPLDDGLQLLVQRDLLLAAFKVELPLSQAALGLLDANSGELIDRRHGDARIDRRQDRTKLCGIDPIAEPGHAFVQLAPERDTILGRYV